MRRVTGSISTTGNVGKGEGDTCVFRSVLRVTDDCGDGDDDDGGTAEELLLPLLLLKGLEPVVIHISSATDFALLRVPPALPSFAPSPSSPLASPAFCFLLFFAIILSRRFVNSFLLCKKRIFSFFLSPSFRSATVKTFLSFVGEGKSTPGSETTTAGGRGGGSFGRERVSEAERRVGLTRFPWSCSSPFSSPWLFFLVPPSPLSFSLAPSSSWSLFSVSSTSSSSLSLLFSFSPITSSSNSTTSIMSGSGDSAEYGRVGGWDLVWRRFEARVGGAWISTSTKI